MNNLREALNKIAHRHSMGNIPDDVLIKACDNYKINSNFSDDYDYSLIVSKSFYDHINGVEPNKEICKGVLPGQTKMIDGVMYVYTATPNAKTDYDWRVVTKGTKTNKSVGRGSGLSSTSVQSKQKFVNDMFPKDLSVLKVVKQLGGSTGAVLVEDKVTNQQYVMKKGTNTSNEHIKSEYLANQLYDAMGQRVPDYELYDDNGTAVMLSKFIPMTKMPQTSDYAEMAKGLISDVLLANWDVYQNDNCLIDSANRVIRVDNGGCLQYRAQGKQKVFDDDVVKTFKDMKKYNPMVFSQLSEQEIIDQIDDIIKTKKDDVVNYLKENNDPLAVVMEQRFNNLIKVKQYLQKQIAINNPVVQPRQLKPVKDMYKTFTDDELDVIWKAAVGANGRQKLYQSDKSEGWNLLSEICKERGFDARPDVLDEADYWKKIASSKQPQLFRGLTGGGGYTAQNLVNMFKYDDVCFYGNYGLYGEGIYAHVNDGDHNKDKTKAGYMKSDAFKQASSSYAGGTSDNVLLIGFEDDAKIGIVKDLVKEISDNPPVSINTPKAKKAQKEADDLKSTLDKTEDELNHITDKTIKKVYSDMHYDAASIADMQIQIDNTNWGELNDEGDAAYPSWDDFVVSKMCDWITSNGGKAISEQGQYVFTLPNTKEKFLLTKYQYENNAIKQKNSFTTPYHFAIKRFENWVMKEHVAKVEKAKNEAVDNLGDAIVILKDKISDAKKKYNQKLDEVKLASNPNPDDSIYNAIYDDVTNHGDIESVGVYAALKGYDAIYAPHGNGTSNGYMVILNRSKLFVKK